MNLSLLLQTIKFHKTIAIQNPDLAMLMYMYKVTSQINGGEMLSSVTVPPDSISLFYCVKGKSF